MFDPTKPVLVVVAHSDDETLMFGGLLHRLYRQYRTPTHVLWMTYGLSHREVQMPTAEQDKTRELCAVKAMEVLHIVRHGFLTADMRWSDRPCYRPGSLQRLPSQVLADVLIEHVRAWSIRTVLTHWPEDTHQDHRAVAQAVHIAVRPGNTPVQSLLYGMPTIPSVPHMQQFTPNVLIQLSAEDVEKKRAALGHYITELRSPPHPRSPYWVDVNSLYHGGLANWMRAEGLVLGYSLLGDGDGRADAELPVVRDARPGGEDNG